MKLTHLCKAYPLHLPDDEKEIEGQILIIDSKIPTTMSLDECEEFYESQADTINRVLSETLPQGIYDRLGISFMQRKISLYQGRTGT